MGSGELKLIDRRQYERIAFFGPMCSGKTWAAKFLIDHHNYAQFGFAEGVKETARKLFGVQGKDGNDRVILQQVGAKMREINPDVWVDLCLNEIDKFEQDYLWDNKTLPKIVVDDLRYENEAIALRDNGFTLVLINTPQITRWHRVAHLYPNTSLDAHNSPSEQDWTKINPDYTVHGTEPERAAKDIEAILANTGVEDVNYIPHY